MDDVTATHEIGRPKLEAPARSRAHAREVPVLGLTKVEASVALSMSVDSFERYVMPGVRVVRRGRLVIVPVRELERWLESEAERTLG